MFEGIVDVVGFNNFFAAATLLAVGLGPTGGVVRGRLPIIGTGVRALGSVVQVAYGAAVVGSTYSDTIRTFLVGA